MPHTTGLTALVQGGTALNIVPDRCTVGFEFRAIAGDDPRGLAETVLAYARDVLVPEMQARDPSCGIAVESRDRLSGPRHRSRRAPRHRRQAARRPQRGHAKVSYGTEAGLFQSLGDLPSVVIGPGDIARANKADEYVETAELAECAAFLRR